MTLPLVDANLAHSVWVPAECMSEALILAHHSQQTLQTSSPCGLCVSLGCLPTAHTSSSVHLPKLSNGQEEVICFDNDVSCQHTISITDDLQFEVSTLELRPNWTAAT